MKSQRAIAAGQLMVTDHLAALEYLSQATKDSRDTGGIEREYPPVESPDHVQGTVMHGT